MAKRTKEALVYLAGKVERVISSLPLGETMRKRLQNIAIKMRASGADPVDVVKAWKREAGTYKLLGELYGPSAAAFWKAGERGNVMPVIREVLGYPPQTVAVEPCTCGKVHSHKCAAGIRAERLRGDRGMITIQPEAAARIGIKHTEVNAVWMLERITAIAVPFLESKLTNG